MLWCTAGLLFLLAQGPDRLAVLLDQSPTSPADEAADKAASSHRLQRQRLTANWVLHWLMQLALTLEQVHQQSTDEAATNGHQLGDAGDDGCRPSVPVPANNSRARHLHRNPIMFAGCGHTVQHHPWPCEQKCIVNAAPGRTQACCPACHASRTRSFEALPVHGGSPQLPHVPSSSSPYCIHHCCPSANA